MELVVSSSDFACLNLMPHKSWCFQLKKKIVCKYIVQGISTRGPCFKVFFFTQKFILADAELPRTQKLALIEDTL